MINKIFNRLVFLLLLVFFSQNASGIIMLQDGVKERTIQPEEIFIYSDPGGSVDLKKVLSGEQKPQFLPLKSTILPPIYEGTYWLKVLVIDESANDQNWVLQCTDPNILVLEAWIPDNRGGYHLERAGLQNAAGKKHHHKDHIFTLPSGLKHYILYLKTASPNAINLNLKIRTQTYLTEHTATEYLFYGFSYGILLILLFLGITRYLTGSNGVYILFSLYLLSCVLLALSHDGLGAQFIWTSYASGNLHYYYFLAPQLLLAASVLFTRTFLNLKATFPAGDNILLAISGIILSLMVARSTINDFSFPIWYGIPYLFILLLALYIWFKGFTAARFFVVGNTVLFSATYFFLQRTSVASLSANALHLVMLVHAMVLWLALHDRNRLLTQKSKAEAKLPTDSNPADAESDPLKKHDLPVQGVRA